MLDDMLENVHLMQKKAVKENQRNQKDTGMQEKNQNLTTSILTLNVNGLTI